MSEEDIIEEKVDADDPDDLEMKETPKDIIDILGFDPAREKEEE